MARQRVNELNAHRAHRKRGRKSQLPLIITVSCIVVGIIAAGGYLGYRRLAAVRPKPFVHPNGGQPGDRGAQPEELLIGRWVGHHAEDPQREVRYEFRRGGSFILTGVHPGVATVTARGIWQVLSSKGNTLRLKMRTDEREVVDNRGNRVQPVPDENPQDFEEEVEFSSNDHFRLTTNKGRVFEATRHP